MPVIRHSIVVVMFVSTIIFSSFALAQDTTTSGSDQSSSTTPASTQGNSTANGNTTASTTNQAAQTTASTTNVTAITSEQLSAFEQQRQQLSQQFTQQLATATPEERLALVSNFRQQLDSLIVSVEPPPPTAAQIATQSAAQVAYIQNLPSVNQQAYSMMQQRQQLTQQVVAATPEQRLALIGQINDLVTQQEALIPQSLGLPPSPAALAQAKANWLANLSSDDQTAIQAMQTRSQAIHATMQLSPDQRLSALQTILAQPLPLTTSGNMTSNSGPLSGNTSSNTTLSSPPTGQ